ncbi:MAG: hypothetical protein U0165_12440 [Polyangiaceae bacterium]
MDETTESPQPIVTLAAPALVRPLALVMAVVVVSGVAVECLKAPLGLDAHNGVLPMFSLSYEWNIPTLYSAALLGLCSLTLGLVAHVSRLTKQPYVGRWRLLSLGFAYIAVDEVLQLHEHADALVSLNHIFYFDWIVPAGVLLVVLALFYVPFLRWLPSRDRNRFVLAGVIYVGGAVAMEIPLGWWTSHHGQENLGYALIDAVEESLEMLGLNLFLLSLVDYLASRSASLRFEKA